MKQVFPLSLIIGFRFFGLFIVLPVLSAYALGLEGSSEILVGIVVGGYALTQAMFQVPFGVLSDKIGRKKSILVGLLIFAAGSIVAGMATDIYTLMLGRFLQGAGAVGSVISAMIADFVKEEQRAHAMAIMGGTIALSFALALLAGPLIGGAFGVDKLFFITAFLSFASIVVLFTIVGTAPKIKHSYDTKKVKLKEVFEDKNLVSMFVTFLFHSSIMTMAFLIIPIVMTSEFGWEKIDLWKVYVPAIILGILAMGPAAVFGEKKGKGKQVFIVSVLFIAVGFAFMGFANNEVLFVVGSTSFFIGFNMFEPLLQSFVAKFSKVHKRGASLGVANSFAYFGAFFGGILGGVILQYSSRSTLSLVVLTLCVLWILWIKKMKNPAFRKNIYLNLNEINQNNINNLDNLNGIFEHYINENENILVIKYEVEKTNDENIKNALS
jgi:MFS family permease